MGVSNKIVVSRRALVLGLAAVVATGASASSPPRVLFICQFGTAKSAIAREFFRRRARERGILVSAFSRGLTLEDHISSPLGAALRAEGIDPAHDRPQVLTRRDLRAAGIVVVFNPVPATFGPVAARNWTALPSVNENWPAARTELVQRIDVLLDEIAKRRR